MPVLEFDTYRRLAEVPGDYRVTVEKTRGRWVAHCGLCKVRNSFSTHPDAIAWADDVHPRSRSHEQWTGRLAAGGYLSVRRGYDCFRSDRRCPCGVCDWCDLTRRAVPEPRVSHPADDLSRRRVVPAPDLEISRPLGPIDVTWDWGQRSTGTRYRLYVGNVLLGEIAILTDGTWGWVRGGRYVPAEENLTAAYRGAA